MRIVFDFDDTICLHDTIDRSIRDARPNWPLIYKIVKLSAEGNEIVIYTARGQKSCGGDLEKIEAKYRKEISDWLRDNEVPYNEIVFGKPLGDLYVDDRAVSTSEFCRGPIERISGGNSGAVIYRMGDRCIKICPDAGAQGEWYTKARRCGIAVPEVHSAVLDSLDMEYIPGRTGAEIWLTEGHILRICETIRIMSKIKGEYRFPVEPLIRRCNEHLAAVGEPGLDILATYLRCYEEPLNSRSSFCHGDLSLSNIIVHYRHRDEWPIEPQIFFIDPIQKEYSSYLLDFAKLRWSLNGGEEFLHGRTDMQRDYPELKAKLDAMIPNEDHGLVVALEATYWIRLLSYNPDRAEWILEKADSVACEIGIEL